MLEGGIKFKEARENRSYSLDKVEQLTRIPAKYLAAIEAGDESALPDYTYALGFMRSYARFLNIDSGEIVASYKELYKEKDFTPIEPSNYDSRRAIKKANRTPLKKWQIILFVLIALAIIGFSAVYLLGVISNNNNDEPNQPDQPGVVTEDPGVTPEPPVVPDENPDEPDEPDDEPPVEVIYPLEIKITAVSGKCWIGATASNGAYTNVTLQQGDSRTFTDDEYYKITFGNAGGVTVIINGITQEPLGRVWEVVTKEFFAEEYSL